MISSRDPEFVTGVVLCIVGCGGLLFTWVKTRLQIRAQRARDRVAKAEAAGVFSVETNDRLAHGVCPYCGVPLLRGPEGGCSRQHLCPDCMVEFSVTLGCAHTTGEVTRERAAQVYGVSSLFCQADRDLVGYHPYTVSSRHPNMCGSYADVKLVYFKTAGHYLQPGVPLCAECRSKFRHPWSLAAWNDEAVVKEQNKP